MRYTIVVATMVCVLAGCPPPEPTPTPPPTADSCAEACARWRANDCKDGEDVCDEFDDETGECTRSVSCEVACDRDPDKYDTAAVCP